MDDAVRLSADAFRNVYEASFKLWFTLYHNAIENPGLPASYLAVHNAFRLHSAFLRGLKLKSTKFSKHTDAISVSILETPERGSDMASWLDRKDQNYVSWAEVMPGPCSLTYTDKRAAGHPDGGTTKQQAHQAAATLMIGDASPEEARWWAAILAPDQGWQASMAFAQDTILLSPWSFKLESGPCFILHAALATVLLFPSMGAGRRLKLPALTINDQEPSTKDAVLSSSRQSNPANGYLRHDWTYDDTRLNRLITLSCNTAAMRPILLRARAAIDSLAQDRPLVLARMLMDRVPQVASLWLGVTILGLQKELLQDVRYACIPIGIPSAVWSGTIQSFLQQPVSSPPVYRGRVSRADQCRLLFLSRTGLHDRAPVCQWRPFGTTPIDDTDVEVRLHARCKNHVLQYQGFSWDCAEGSVEVCPITRGGTDMHTTTPLKPKPLTSPEQIPISYGGLDRERESASENATRQIFGWLRFEEYAADEKGIWEHEWFKILDSDDEDGYGSKGGSASSPKSLAQKKSSFSGSHVETWLERTE
ncbi:uncharacterized protein B0T15DRAFT_482102 [Chaetomium strumarium]|uniref:Uncharacterized protein n=1 Tax=Chaetomium strumarium TaxID=1170767 RepID=A0AAJ0M6T4_9PEZI|nr:hypothetical protein B0T15DRAFT_482102 [Chaetomium strumarium]